MIACALFQPDIPQNAGAILRLGACFGVPVHIVHPIGFALSDRNLRRAGMDYIDRAVLQEHADWSSFRGWQLASGRRLLAFTTKGESGLYDFSFHPDDLLLFGRESGGLPEEVRSVADARLRIPIRRETRSLNLAISAAMAVAEALRQTGQLPSGGGELAETEPGAKP
jgi:tRNA (cytidine/uridine-2'-O-)-methyltransferase